MEAVGDSEEESLHCYLCKSCFVVGSFLTVTLENVDTAICVSMMNAA